jgi:hypothetical protein
MKFRDLDEPVRNVVTFLLIISLPAEKQFEVHGIGNPASEMPDYIHFPTEFDADIQKIKADEMLPPNVISTIENFVTELRLHKEDFWRIFNKVSTDWDNVRKKAKALIKEIGLEELEIITKFTRDVYYPGTAFLERPSLWIIIERDRNDEELKQAIAEFERQE